MNHLSEYPLTFPMLSDQNMGEAWRHVKANKGSPGIDNMSIEAFELFVNSHWQGLKTKLIEGNYQPLPVKRMIIPKPDAGERLLGIPIVMDRVIQKAISAPSLNQHFHRLAMDIDEVNEQVRRLVMFCICGVVSGLMVGPILKTLARHTRIGCKVKGCYQTVFLSMIQLLGLCHP